MEKGKKKERVREAKSNLSSIPASRKFVTVDDIRSSLRSQDVRKLTQALTTLGDQLTIRSDETGLGPQDERLLLAKAWLEEAPGTQEIFSIIKRESKPDPHVTSRCLAVLSALLNLFSKHFIYHSLGQSIIKTLLLSHMQQLNSNLAHSSFELISSTLNLLIAMSAYAGGLEKRSVMDGFAWGQKTHQKLLFLRRKRTEGRTVNPLTDMDVRTLFITFILSFLSSGTPTSIKLTILEKYKDIFLLIFKGISQDSYVVARRILEVCWEDIWGDPKISRTLKVGLFKESTLNHLLKLYNRHDAEDDIVEHVPADLIHHFMLSIMTRPGVGICFKDRGWYPRDNLSEEMEIKKSDLDVGEELTTGQGGKIYNKILANIIKNLKINEDARQQELAFKIFEACPELVASYWSAAALTLEPRISSRWITNLSVLGTIIALPIPTTSFLLPHSTHFNPSPPPLSSILANILPSVLNKTHLTKGLQSPSSLVRHCTTLVLSKCLIKLENVLSAFRNIAHSVEEDSETGQWLQRSAELITEIQRRIPDFMVIVAIVQQKTFQASVHEAKGGLLAESALRLLWLYHKLFPRLLAEARFDVGRLLLGIFDQTTGGGNLDFSEPKNQKRHSGLEVVRQLHVLRLLKESHQFVWSNKAGASSHSYLYAILTLYAKAPHPAVRASTTILITQLLSSSILFSHDPAELRLWLSALPLTQRGLDAAAPDGTPLTDEISGVLVFLDECIQRCLKMPYRYLEDTLSFFGEPKGEINRNGDAPLTQNEPDMVPSPLLMTILEQLRTKIVANNLSPSDILAVATFVRKLVCGLPTKLRDLRHARNLATELCKVFSTVSSTPCSSVLHAAIKRESNFPLRILGFIQDPHHDSPTSTSSVAQEFLLQIESLAIPSSEAAALSTAYGFVDWMRFVDLELHPSEVKRLFNVIIQFSPLAATEFFYQLEPQLDQLWFLSGDYREIMNRSLPFEWAYIHSAPTHLLRENVKDILVSLFFAPTPWNSQPERRISIVMHRLPGDGAAPRRAELSLLVSIMHHARSQLSDIDLARLKQYLFQESTPLREIFYARDVSSVELTEIVDLVRVSLDPRMDLDRKLTLEYCNYWLAESDNTSTLHQCNLASPWIPFMDPMGVIKFLDISIRALGDLKLSTGREQNTFAVILETLTHFSSDAAVLTELHHRMQGLLAIRQSSNQHDTVDKLLLQVVTSKLPLGCDTLPLSPTSSCTMSDVGQRAQERWDPRANPPQLDATLISTCLHSSVWDETVARIVSGLIYRSSTSRSTFWAWLRETEPPQANFIVVPLHAYLDVMSLQDENNMMGLPHPWFLTVLRRLFSGESSDGIRILCSSCIRLLFRALPSSQANFVTCLSNEVHPERDGGTFWNIHSIRLFYDLYRLDALALSDLVMHVIHEGLKWIVGQISSNKMSEDDALIFVELCNLVSCVKPETHIVEPVIKAAIKDCLHMPSVTRCLASLVPTIPLTPATVNRQLQSIVQHSQLYSVTNHGLPSREPIIKLLHVLFVVHPANTCQPSHLAPLARLYGGTMSLSDRLLLSIFSLYETHRKESVASIFRSWSPTISAPPFRDTFRAITNLDPVRVLRTYTNFPTRRRLDETPVANVTYDTLYDPVFLTLLVAQLLSDKKNLSSTEWVQVFRSNIISVVICVLTSRDHNFRKVGVATLAGVLRRVQEAELHEKEQVLYIMNMLRDILPPALPPSPTPRLSTYPVVLLAHALRATFYPSGFLYPVVSRFLLQRPELDTMDVPMLYSLLYSSEDGEWAKERMWMIRFLTEAMHEGGFLDWIVFKRRHTWDIVASMWQATNPEEGPLRKGILELLATLSANPHVVNSLILRSSLLTWIEMQLDAGVIIDVEQIAWIKILENVIVTADGNKADRATQGEFGATFSRCLCLLLHGIADSVSLSSRIGRLELIARVLLRVANQSLCPHHLVANILRNAMNVLRSIELQIRWVTEVKASELDKPTITSEPPHQAEGLFDVPGDGTSGDTWCPLRQWANTVVALWEVAMMLDQCHRSSEIETWDSLTCRLLVLRASPSFDSRSPSNVARIAEWARRETVKGLLRAGEDASIKLNK